MSSMKQNMMPSLYNVSYNAAFKTYSTLLCQLLLMGPKLTAAMKHKTSLDISKQVVRPLRRSGRFTDPKKSRYLLKKGRLDTNRLHLYNRKGCEKGSYKIHVVITSAESRDVVTEFDLKFFRKPHVEKGYGTEPFKLELTLADLLVRLTDFSCLKLPTLMAFFHQLPMYMPKYLLNRFCQQLLFETWEYAKDLLTECSESIALKPKKLYPLCRQSKAETIELAKNLEKPAEKPVSSLTSVKAESQVSGNLPEQISTKTVQICYECREPIRTKKFFDERRFGILEKCKCVICYGCLRKLTGATDRVVKGPVRCPICFAMSDNVASSANWIHDENKVKFFEEYCKNVQNIDMKMRLGWTSFPTRKDDLWTRAPQMVPVN